MLHISEAAAAAAAASRSATCLAAPAYLRAWPLAPAGLCRMK